MPNAYKNINVRSIYEPQGMIKLEEEEKNDFIEKEDLSEDNELEKSKRINEIYVEILDYILGYVLKNGHLSRLEDIISSLKEEKDHFNRFVEDRLLFTTILKLYDIGAIDIEEWRNRGNNVVMNLSEEFNLEFCLYQLMNKHDYITSIGKIEILKSDDDLIEVEIKRSIKEDLHVIEKIEISNFTIKVEKKSE